MARIHADPELMERKRANLRANFADPSFVAQHTTRLREGVARASKNPAFIENRREHGRAQYRNVLSRPDVKARLHSPETCARRGRSRTDTVLGWCPEHLRAEYRKLIKIKQLSAAEARRVIEALIPGTVEHAKAEVASRAAAMQLSHERDLRDRY
jgi:hypothetical protein